MNRLIGKSVLITAAGQGMGRAAALAMAAEGATVGVELSTNDTTRSLGVYTTNTALDYGVQMIDNGTKRDYNLSVGNTVEMPVGFAGTAYVKGEAEYNWGDSYTKAEMHITPAVGFKTKLAQIAPFVEAGYRLKSIEGDYTNVNRDAPYAKLGTSYQLTLNTALNLDVTQSMDKKWKSTDRELGAKLTFKF